MTEVTVGSGNVFADLGFADPEKELLRAHVVHTILRITKDRNWKQKELAAHLGISESQVSDLVHGRYSHFSLERLLKMLPKLDYDVTIQVKAKPNNRPARIHVSA